MTLEEVKALEPGTLLVWIRGPVHGDDMLVEYAGGTSGAGSGPYVLCRLFGSSPVTLNVDRLRLPTTNDLLVLEGPT